MEQAAAPTLLLETKLYVPHAPQGLVPRPRLTERLDRGARSKLTLVSAPAGFGKTTLLAAWLGAGRAATHDARSVAWLSLDREDNDPATFWTYVVAALRTVLPDVGGAALALLQSPQPAPVTAVLTTLLNDLAGVERDVVLVLDDYHLVDASEVQQGMAFLLDHLPGQLHMVIAGRADPALPLARLRVRGELVEARAADLRFTSDEAVAYLNGVMGLALTDDDVVALESRTEGWIAALQLAALSLQGRDDSADFIAGFAGDARYVVDYLVEEVLHRQPEQVQSFLLQTAILERLSGPLCDAVTARTGGSATLESLDRGNLFLVPLDDRRRWYRYHHLFADVLRARLQDETPELLPSLHRRASDWWEEHGERGVAIDHALAAGDVERAADLVELAMPAMRKNRREATARAWLQRLPDRLFRHRPVLAIQYVGVRLATGDVDGAEERLRDAERWLDVSTGGPAARAEAGDDLVVLDEDEFRRLPSWVVIYRAAQALLKGDPATTVTLARRGSALIEDDDHLGRGAAAALIGLASWGSGDLEAAHAGYAQSMASLQRAGHIADVLGAAITLADIEIVQGRLGAAERTYERSLQLAAEPDGTVLRGTADMYVGLAALHRERDDLPEANRLLLRSQALGEHLGMPQNPHRWRVAMARVREAEGDLAAAVDLLDEAERVYAGDFSPDVRPIAALRARVWIKQGRFDDAGEWVRDRGLSSEDELSYLREVEHVTVARLLLGRLRLDREGRTGGELTRLLDRLLAAAESGGRNGSVLEILVLQALTHQTRGDAVAAARSLERALAIGEPEGYARVFLDEGPGMTALLRAAALREPSQRYVQRLLGSVPASLSGLPGAAAIVDPLSDREIDVLRLLATDLGGPDIARELVISLNTVRTHTKSIYAKLGVSSRRAAVRQARELHLLR